MFIERFGGIHAVEDRLPNDRLPLVRSMYPGIVAACRARGIPIPTEGAQLSTGDRRLLEARAQTLLEQWESAGDDNALED